MTISSSTDLFFDQLKDIHSVVDQVTQTLPDLIGWSTEASLKSLLNRHHLESQRHREEVKEIFESHGVEAGNDPCKAMQGLIEGGNKHIEQAGDPIARDLLLIAHTTRIAHYEVAAYGFASAMAEKVGLTAEVQVLAEILEEDEGFLRDLAAIGLKQFGVPVGSVA